MRIIKYGRLLLILNNYKSATAFHVPTHEPYSTSTSYVDAVTLDSYATVVVLVKERKRKIVKLEEPGIVKR